MATPASEKRYIGWSGEPRLWQTHIPSDVPATRVRRLQATEKTVRRTKTSPLRRGLRH
ncbi:hypothetical protein CC85DRAFT_283768 [Cutaneotrichosporon oleaginosum]|uniref:Uncharacterized protein n=1 Tax=Cutaneotrichosporon oleaginosum TaxID=879819 RepID=A0A0J1B8Y0_9TREE|nr:uncharacterized protein CC85DRAFT_283768 [Cutaneotrichosporon oleaginosum]KLT44254.1 hypothetical protein CC85DRAFT_283768 [Cutaneotrichosporon oleaginosum]TXT11578.1 hypothetical protein COLE_01988 [Cutaneotrichosporon oleaginosum]